MGVLPEINIYALIIALATLLISSITSLKQAALRNLISTSKALWPTMLFSPAMTITCVLIVIKLVGTINLNLLMAITLLSSLLAYLISEALFYRYSKAANAKPARNSFNIIKRDQFINALPFMGLAALAILNSRIDIFILGIYRSSEEVATYAVAMKFFDAMLIPITLLNMLIATKVASYFYKNELEKLQRLITDTSRATFVSALVIGVLIIEFRNESVNLIFGNVYARSTDLITFLVVAQIINAFGASSGMILSMCHKESLSLKIGLICAIVNLIGNIILTPRLGPMGAAIATSISFVVWRVAFMTATKISLNLNPTPL